MATTFAVSDILADVANLSNCPAFTPLTRITLAQATYWVAQSARSLSALLRQRHGDDREFLQIAAIYTIPTLPLLSLPPDCGEVHSVMWLRGANDAVLLETASADDITRRPLDEGTGWDNGTDGPVGSESWLPRWRLEGQTIGFYPASGLSESLEVFYTSHLSPTSGTFQGRLDFDRWVTLDLCVKVATAKDKDGAVMKFQQQKALLENDLLSTARKRDVHGRHVMRDMRAESARGYFRNRWGY